MEMIILAALEWKVCKADKVDYVDAFLNVMFPKDGCCDNSIDCSINSSNNDDAKNNNNEPPILTGMRDLAKLQIQLSDFESSFSRERPSLVAFAAVLNAFDMKKDEGMTNIQQHLFLESVQHLMNKMYPLHRNTPSRSRSNSNRKRERQELARTVDRLRALVDPDAASSVSGSTRCCTPTSHQRQYAFDYSCSEDSEDDRSTAADIDVSPLDMALDSMETFDVAQLLCCGSGTEHAKQSAFYGNIHQIQDGSSRNNDDHSMMITDDAAVVTQIESATSFGSIDHNTATAGTSKNYQANKKQIVTNHSPTSIANILFGASM